MARLDFKGLSFTVHQRSSRQKPRQVLHNVSGSLVPGDFVALMGASGAGKTTLLNILSRRITNHAGAVLLNGKPATATDLAGCSCVIQQEDAFFGYLTVEEHLSLQSQIRVPLPPAQRKERVACVLEEFGLTKIRSLQIGNMEQGTDRGIAGGEKKRLSVATDLLTNPALIFADEPTSGLDACKAESLVTVLRDLADSGHTVVATIHQPSSQVFSLFNKVMLLAAGRLLYFGDRMGALPYFLRLGCPCPPYTNPADFLVGVASVDYAAPSCKTKQLQEWGDIWCRTGEAFQREWTEELQQRFLQSLGPETTDASEGHRVPGSGNSKTGGAAVFRLARDPRTGKTSDVPWQQKFCAVLRRAVLVTSRNPSVVRARLLQATVTAVLGGLVFFRVDEGSWYSRSGAVFFMMINQAFMATFTALMAFVAEKKVVLRESEAGLYSLGLYYVCKILSDFVFQFHLPILYTSICWFLVGLNDNPIRFAMAVGWTWLINLACSSIGYIIGAIAPSTGVAVALGPIVVLPCLLVSGFVVQKEALSKFWLWLYHLSPFVYANSALMRTAFLDVEFKHVDPPADLGSSLNFAVRRSGNEVLRGFGLSTAADRWIVDIRGLLLWGVVGRVLAGILFMLVNRPASPLKLV